MTTQLIIILTYIGGPVFIATVQVLISNNYISDQKRFYYHGKLYYSIL